MTMPCNNCGFCCLLELCETAQKVHGEPKRRRCPSLRWVGNGQESRCGILEDLPDRLKKEFAWIIGVGEGCTMESQVRGVDGKMHDFKSLPDKDKVEIATAQRRGFVGVHWDE